MPTKTLVMICIFFSVVLAGCAPEATATQISAESMLTEAAETVEAMLTVSATNAPTMTPTATATVSPTPTISPTVAATAVPLPSAATNSVSYTYTSTACDVAGFVSDVTIPDNTEILGGNTFTKIWSLRNDGTCTWTSSYLLVFYSGSLMDGPSSQQLTDDTVAPGETLQVSVALTAPETTGTYTGYWILRNASGTNFGIGTNASPFYLQIVVDTVATYTPTVTETSEETDATSTSTTAPTATSTTAAEATSTPTLELTPTSAPTETPVPTETPASANTPGA